MEKKKEIKIEGGGWIHKRMLYIIWLYAGWRVILNRNRWHVYYRFSFLTKEKKIRYGKKARRYYYTNKIRALGSQTRAKRRLLYIKEGTRSFTKDYPLGKRPWHC
jgi:hypothetical protein